MIRNFILLFALSLSSFLVDAAPVSAGLSWSAPTARTDGTPLAASELASYRIYSAVGGNVSTDAESAHVVVTGATTQVISIDLVPRAAPYTLRFGARVVDTKGNISALSNIAETTVLVTSTAPPNAPTLLKFQLNCTSGCVITEVK